MTKDVSMRRAVAHSSISICMLLVAVHLFGCAGASAPPNANDSVQSAPNDNSNPANGNTDTADTIDAGEANPLLDPLSMPGEATLAMENFRSASQCAACHPNHYNEWRTSMHSYAMIDPVFRALVEARQRDFDGERDRFCTQCHSAIGTRGGDIVEHFSFDELEPITLEGITCESCHKVTGIVRPYNSGHVLDDNAAMHGPIQDPVENAFHESKYSPLHDTSEFCAGCHDVVEQSGLNLERPYEEWVTSPAGEAGRNCQSCHMPTYSGTAVDPAIAEALGAPERDNLHRHWFSGVDLPLTDDFLSEDELEEARARVVALLESAGEIEVTAAPTVVAGGQIDVFVTVRNLIDAHNLPTGSTFNRQLWISVTATDAEGTAIYQTGDLDANGDLRNHFSELDPYGDADLITFNSGFIDADGNPTVYPWKAAEHISNSLAPLYEVTHTFFVPTSPETVGPVTIETRLRFRAFPPFLLRTLGLPQYIDKLDITDIDEATITVEVE
ncbi:MAG: hypothetical protein IID36_14360 [Planctomycetes bacterium]|nr:hypothetical protein [Planctomycetota bacterium]